MTAVDTPTIGVVARWAERRPTQTKVCDECSELVTSQSGRCANCGQLITVLTGLLAVVIETHTGDRRLVICERTERGGSWTPIRVVRANDEGIRMLRRSVRDRTSSDAELLEAVAR